MTELPGEKPAPKTKNCPKCGRFIGELVEIEGVEWLVMNGQIIRNMNSICECGEMLYFNISDRMMEKILQRNKQHKADLLSHKT
jgi:hypothetical protein